VISWEVVWAREILLVNRKSSGKMKAYQMGELISESLISSWRRKKRWSVPGRRGE
jgi:hypothetical protein